jgi:hypothetical protein
VRVGVGNESILERIHTELVAQHQPSFQSITHIVAGKSAKGVLSRFAGFEQLLERALFVRCP